MWSLRMWLALSVLALMGAMALAASVKDDYKTPTITIPYAYQKPSIDGVINDAEWRGAAMISALQTTNHQVSSRQATYYFAWDEDNLYVAMRSPLRPGERIVQGFRDPSKDINVVFDDSYEVWLDVGAHSKDGQPVFFQYLGNYAGARYDVLYEPAVGNSRVGWTAGWEPKNRLTPDGKTWELEIRIPRASVYKEKPFIDGDTLTCLLARNFKRPWEQNSIEGTSSFAVRESHSHFVLHKDAPAVRILSVGDAAKGTLGLVMSAESRAAGKLRWQFTSDGGVKDGGELDLAPGKAVTVDRPELDKPDKGSYRITVTSADGKVTYFDWCASRAFGNPKDALAPQNDTGDRVGLSLEFNPVHNYARVSGDFINYDARDTIAKCRVDVLNAQGKVLATQDMTIDKLAYINGVVKVPDLPIGEYTTKMTCVGKDGKEILSRESKFTKKDPTTFPWWNTSLGNIEKVIEPWTPVTYKNGTAGVWGREMTVGPLGLPMKITSQNIPLLADAAKLVATLPDGKVVTAREAEVKVVSKADHRLVLDVTGKVGELPVKSRVTIEFDGMYKVEMTVGGATPVAVKSLQVVVPLANAVADFLHATGEGIRYGFYYGFLPKDKTGCIWDCLTVDSQPMLVGSFIPYLYVGNPKAGLCWYADSDQGWVPNDKVPAIEIRRDGKKSTDLVLNLISSDFTITSPRTITFAFEAAPAKPLQKAWRMDPWWCGDTFRDWSCKPGGDVIWTAIPFTLDKEKCRQMVDEHHKGVNSFIFGVSKYHAPVVPYFIHQSLPAQYVPEVNYFGDEWRTSVSSGLYYGKTLADYMIYNLGTWAKECGIDGYYIDNMYPTADDNIDAGRGYRLPDGRVQPTYHMFATRDYFLRMRAAFSEQGRFDKVVLHMTNNMILPWVQAAGVAYDGEHNVIYPEMGKDFMDFWSLERLRADFSGQWGVAVNFMHEYQGAWDQAALKKAMRAYTGAIILHDALPSGNANGMNQDVWRGRDRFGIEADDVTFVGYWDNDPRLKCANKDVYLAVWLRPGKLLLAVVNYGEKTDAAVTLDLKKLNLAATDKIYDAETQQPLTMDANGKITMPVDRHDYRQIIIEP